MTWHKGLLFRSAKEIKTKGELFRRCLKSYRAKTKDTVKSVLIADRAGISSARLTSFVQGSWEDLPSDVFTKILASIKLTEADFNTLAKKSAIPALGIYAADFANLGKQVTATQETVSPVTNAVTPPMKVYKDPVVKSTNKPAVPMAAGVSGMEIENHTFEGFVAVVDKKH